MLIPKNTTTLLMIVAAVIVVAFFFKAITGGRKRSDRYLLTPIMTANEIEFFGRLCRALPQHHVFPQVAMSAIIRPMDTYAQNRGAYYAINKKRIDYAIYSETMTLIALVELDDKMHNVAKDEKRDALTASAGVRTVRWQSRAKPSEREIARMLLVV